MPNLHNAIVVHDRFVFKGGGERLVHTLCQGLELDLVYGEKNDESFDLSGLPGTCIDLKAHSKLLGWRTLKRLRAFLWQTRFLETYDAVIYSGQDAPLAIFNHRRRKNIYYCHTPPRALYDLKDYCLQSVSPGRRVAHHAYQRLFQPLYEKAVRSMDVVVANSKTIQQRIETYLGLPSRIVHPPCDTSAFSWQGQEDYYLSTARLDPLKRVERIVRAFLKMPEKRLIVTSSGPEEEKLRKIVAGASNVFFTGSVDDAEWVRLLGKAIATVYIPKDEDFGLSPVESMAAGKPVVGVAEGGLTETIVPGKTGFLLRSDADPQDIVDAVRELTAARAYSMRRACEERAQLFSNEVFLKKMTAIIEE